MLQELDIKLLPAEANDEALVRERVLRKLGLPANKLQDLRVIRRSVDARGAQPIFLLRVQVAIGEAFSPEPAILSFLKPVGDKKRVLIVGAGPAGYYAALELIERGFKPIVIDRGKDVRARRRDLRAIQQFGEVNPHSNYCFGEGGAGTYSDGKLYTRSHKRGSIEKALRLLVEHGANPDILVDSHPHIGSNKLPNVVANIRETILHYGGEVLFESHVTDLIIEKGKILGVIVNDKQELLGDAVVLATGHSARDIYYLLQKRNILLEAKPFALGVRIEHSQQLIDRLQYRLTDRGEHLPAASYKLVTQAQGRGVFSFCMCPGGLVVPAATEPGEIVVNGMSMSRRDSPYANSGTVVAVELEDLTPFAHEGVLAGLAFQRAVEQAMFKFGDGSQKAPAQRLTDFVAGKISSTLPGTSYIPGLVAAPLHELLPASIYQRLQQGVQDFGRKMKGYYTADANVIGTESRTSSPVRIPRDPDTYQHPTCRALFPAGEGAGFAGGIISAAMDGQNVAAAVAQYLGG